MINLFLILTIFTSQVVFSPAQAEAQITLSQPLIVRWQFESEATVNFTPATDGERVYLPLTSGNLVALRASDGQLIWKAEVGGELSASPIADQRSVYIASQTTGRTNVGLRANGALRALGREGGVTLWMRTLSFPIQGTIAISQTDIFGGARDGRVYAVKKSSGEIDWVAQHSSAFNSQPVLSNSRLYIGAEDGALFSLDESTGKTLWRYQTRGPIRGSVAVIDSVVYVGSADGYVYALDEATGRVRWRTRTGAGVQTVAGTKGGLLVASLDNFVYFLTLNHGKKIWKHQLAGRLASQPLTIDDSALFTPLSGDAGVVLDLKSGKPLNNIPIGEDNNTTASPIAIGNTVFVTTRKGLLAFSRPADQVETKTRKPK